MKRTILLLPVLIGGLALTPAGQVTAQAFTVLHNFTATSGPLSTNNDGTSPRAGLIQSGSSLYGTASGGGSSGNGTVFRIDTDGTGFTNLHSFSYGDGNSPYAGLILSDNTLFGTVPVGGSSGQGAVFKINTDGTGFTNLHSFTAVSGPPKTNSDGSYPLSGLILSSNSLYGTAQEGGSSGVGTVFAVNMDGSGFTNLHSFTATSGPYPGTNSDGAYPVAGLVLSGNTLYGTASGGGSSGNGTVFKVNTDGTGFANLHSFPATSGNFSTNSDGSSPRAGLILSSNTLFGTAILGGSSGHGTVFKVNMDGTGFTILHSFTAASGPYPGTNSDGAYPVGLSMLSGNTLYGMANQGGSSGVGTVFKVNTDGGDFANLHSFVLGSDGGYPIAGLVLSADTLYGTTQSGGSGDNGTAFSLSFAPQLTIAAFGSNVVLSWPSDFAGFSYAGYVLQSAPTSTGTFTNISGATSPYTNPITGAQKFFRLISN